MPPGLFSRVAGNLYRDKQQSSPLPVTRSNQETLRQMNVNHVVVRDPIHKTVPAAFPNISSSVLPPSPSHGSAPFIPAPSDGYPMNSQYESQPATLSAFLRAGGPEADTAAGGAASPSPTSTPFPSSSTAATVLPRGQQPGPGSSNSSSGGGIIHGGGSSSTYQDHDSRMSVDVSAPVAGQDQGTAMPSSLYHHHHQPPSNTTATSTTSYPQVSSFAPPTVGAAMPVGPPHHAAPPHLSYAAVTPPPSVYVPGGSSSSSSAYPFGPPVSNHQPAYQSPATIAAEQAAQAQAALRQAEQAARVAQIHAVAAQAKEVGSGAVPAGRDQPTLRKTAGKYALKDFQVERTLGTGSFGRVHLVKSRHNGRFYAVKVLSKEKVIRMKQVEHTNSEREMLVRVRHPFLVNLWGTFGDARNLFMVMDFVAGGELFSLLRKSQRFPNSVAKFYAAEVALALDYLHSLDIIYRDLKPENILLGADGHVKVTDFGFAKHVPDVTWTLCGTPDYLAPEVVQSKAYNKSVDWYALGVLIFEMLAGYPPFYTEDGNPMKLYEKIIAGKVKYPSYFESPAKDLLRSLLTSDLSKRFGNLRSGSHDIFAHEWFAEVAWDRLYKRAIPAPYVPKIEGDGDTSQFDRYAECDISEYGRPGDDPHGHLFPDF